MELGGLTPEQLTNRHQPCPACQGENRYRWDNDEGGGSCFCNQCGGKDRTGGGMSGVDLLMRVRSWTLPEACRAVERHLGLATDDRPPPPTHGAERFWRYTEDFIVCRFPDPVRGKSVRPLLWTGKAWQWKSPAKPRPLYWARRRAGAPVLVVEGEPSADAAAELFPGHACVTWPGGCPNVDKADWSALRGRSVTIWPDADPPGLKAADMLAGILAAIGCTVAVVTPPDGVRQGWDLANALEDGWTPERAAAELERLAQPVPTAQPPAPPTGQTPNPSTLAAATDRLRQAIASGVSGSVLQQLVAQLAADGDHSPVALSRIATELEREDHHAAAVTLQAAALAAEADRQELGQLISPAYLLPAPIAAAIEARTRYLPCDGPSAVLPYLAAVAGLVKLGTMVEASAVAGYRVPVNLFTCLVGRSGAKKSPVDRLLLQQPLAPLLEEQARADRREREQWREACRQVKRGEPKPEEPCRRHILTSDFTGEGLAEQLELLEQAGRGLLIYREELSGMFGSLNQYRSGRGADEQQLLELYDGSGMTSLRVSGGRSYGRSQVSIAGGTQPDVLRQLVAHGDASGLWARFLFCPLPERVVRLPLHTTADEVAEVEAAARLLAECCSRVFSMPPAVYRLSSAAAERFANYEERQQREALRATIGAQGAVHGKASGKALRVAGVLHLLAIAVGDLPSSAEIEADAIDRACVLVDHLDGWALGLHADVNSGELPSLLRAIHRAAEAAEAPVAWRQVYARLGRTQRQGANAAAAGEAMRALAAAGYGELVAGPHDSMLYRALKPLP
jgi:hypothetical protein